MFYYNFIVYVYTYNASPSEKHVHSHAINNWSRLATHQVEGTRQDGETGAPLRESAAHISRGRLAKNPIIHFAG